MSWDPNKSPPVTFNCTQPGTILSPLEQATAELNAIEKKLSSFALGRLSGASEIKSSIKIVVQGLIRNGFDQSLPPEISTKLIKMIKTANGLCANEAKEVSKIVSHVKPKLDKIDAHLDSTSKELTHLALILTSENMRQVHQRLHEIEPLLTTIPTMLEEIATNVKKATKGFEGTPQIQEINQLIEKLNTIALSNLGKYTHILTTENLCLSTSILSSTNSLTSIGESFAESGLSKELLTVFPTQA